MEPPVFNCMVVTGVLLCAICIIVDIEPLELIGTLAAQVLPEAAWCAESVLGAFDGNILL